MSTTIKYQFTLLCFPIFIFSTLSLASAAGDIEVTKCRLRLLPKVSMSTGAFCTFKNKSKKDHKLISVSSPKAKIVELHTHIQKNGMMHMAEVNEILIPKNSTKILEPGGLHIMLIDLVSPTKKGEKVKFLFKFEDKSTKTILVETIDIR